MSDMTSLVAEDRTAVGKGPAQALRQTGRVPGVVYGEKKEQLMFSLEARALRRELQKPRFYSTLCQLEIGGKSVRVLPREVQLHPVTDEPVHADFVYVSRGASVTVEVPVLFLNEDECPGLKRGGVLNVVRREVELVCPADSIPEKIELDLAAADIGDSLHYSHAVVPDNVEPTITDRDFTIATIAAPSGGAEDDEAEGEEGVEGEEGAEAPADADEGDQAGGDEG
ncbi:MAG: 50S ribosomal protein L25/general stress protein Ctc [Alphaproteobacteria bacterium]|nr:50S ribosomal protein L25/general stress protein Ctc [Alphaproteobacteria bacterium]